MQRVTIIWTRYHTRYRALFLSLAGFGGYLQRVTTRYRQLFLKMLIYIFFKIWR